MADPIHLSLRLGLLTARIGQCADRLFLATITLFTSAIVGAFSAIYSGHDDQVLASLIAGGLFGAVLGWLNGEEAG